MCLVGSLQALGAHTPLGWVGPAKGGDCGGVRKHLWNILPQVPATSGDSNQHRFHFWSCKKISHSIFACEVGRMSVLIPIFQRTQRLKGAKDFPELRVRSGLRHPLPTPSFLPSHTPTSVIGCTCTQEVLRDLEGCSRGTALGLSRDSEGRWGSTLVFQTRECVTDTLLPVLLGK